MEETNQAGEANQMVKKSNPMAILVPLVILVVAGGYFLVTRGSQTGEVQNQGEEQMTEQTAPVTEKEATPDVTQEQGADGQVQVVNVTGGGYYFEPNEIRVKVGEKVRIVFTNAGGSHNFVIDELGIKTKLTQTGETAEVEFIAGTAGEYEFYCGVADHRAKGMVGTLIVE